jgi:hypothetical protein
LGRGINGHQRHLAAKPLLAYWTLCKPALEKVREEREDPTLYEEFERLHRLVADIDRKPGIETPTKELLRPIMEAEAVVAEEPTTTA